MLSQSNVMAFLATTNAERAKTFFGETLGLRLVSDDPFALVFDASGTTLRIQKVEAPVIAPYTALGWEVVGIESKVRGLAERGIAFLRIPGMPQDELGVWTTPNGAKVAWFKDPEGATLSLTESPAT